MNPDETSHQKITNLSTAPVKCSHCTLFSETNTVRFAKQNGAITPHRKHLEISAILPLNSVMEFSSWKLHDRIEWQYCRYFPAYSLIIVCFDDVASTSQFAFIVELKQAIVSAWQQLSQAFIGKSINEWRCRLECVVQQNGAISNIRLND